METSEDKNPIIGIDLGTTLSCVAVSQNGSRHVIINEQGKRVTPSYLSFSEDELLVGDPAKANLPLNPENTVYDAKRLIGRRFDDLEVQQNLKRWPFKITEIDKKIKYQVTFKEKTITLYPEEVCAHILRNLKETAEKYLGKEVKDAVITVPAYFNDAQRKATKSAGKIAGLNVVRMINEPTAAALAYGLSNKTDKILKVLVYDLGGGTFDVTVLTIERGIFDVRSTAGNSYLGGQDFVNRLVDYCCKDIKSTTGKDVTQDKTALANLTLMCEEAKRTLSFQKSCKINLAEPDLKYSTTISQSFFEELNHDLFKSTIYYVQAALDDAHFDVTEIDEIVLVGGSTRIPKIRDLLQIHFKGKLLNFTLNPDEGVALGAAIQAAIINKENDKDLQNVVLIDVTPLTLGINSKGTMSVLIPRNRSIPTEETKEYETVEDNQEFVVIKVYEGERKFVRDNNLLDEFVLENLPPGPRSTIIIKVTFSIDANGLLTVAAVETSTGIEKSIVVQNKMKFLSEQDILKAIEDAENFKKLDESLLEVEICRQSLESFCLQLISDFTHNKVKASETATPLIMQECRNALKWCLNNPENSKLDYEKRLNVLKTMYTLNVDVVDAEPVLVKRDEDDDEEEEAIEV